MPVANVVFSCPDHWYSVGIIDSVIELIHVPVYTQQAGVDDTYIFPETFYFLNVP